MNSMSLDRKKKNIAVLSTMYYPVMGAPSACVHKYIAKLKEEYNFHIISRNDELDYPEWPEYDIRYFSSSIHEKRKKLEQNLKINNNKFISRLALGVINVLKLIQTQIYFPTAQRWEVEGYLNELEKLHKECELDVVIPVSNNFVTQLATFKFCKRHPNVKWIAFITDPYSENYIYYKYKLFKKIWKKFNLQKEQDIYDSMTFGMFTSEMFRYAPKTFNIPDNKCFEINFALINERPPHTKTIVRRQNCLLMYAGLFYKEIRNPEFALQILSQVENIEFHMFVGKGECEDIISLYNISNFKRNEFAERDRYLEMLYFEYDILVNIGNKATLQAPSKMLELLSTGKPIINFYHSKDSQFYMIEKYPLGLNIGKDDVDAVKKIKDFCMKMKGKSLPFEEVVKLFPENNIDYQTNLMRKLIEE